MKTGWRRFALVGLLASLLALAACVPQFRESGPRERAPEIGEFFTAADGEKLTYTAWLPDNPGKTYPPKAVIAAVHGFNQYSDHFRRAARYWQRRSIATYAYDQRGFGTNYPRGIWPGREAIVADVKDFVRAVRDRHPGVPLYLLGSSMGGAAVIAALGGPNPPEVDGAILATPAAYGRDLLPVHYSGLLWAGAHTVPWVRVTGQDLGRLPSDNYAMLRSLSMDPRVIKGARIDTIYGLVNLMDMALEAAPNVRGPILFLYGEKDEIIKPPAALLVLDRLPEDSRRVAIYENGYHMLLRDLQAEVVYADVATWVFDRTAPLPSGADRRGTGNLSADAGL
ncbi:MAG: alpha/beta hydrolase [Alphaproteobacteria bacterium]|nr:alpha/beta hydrolase [Alphaproteobacteria bacterium]